DGARLRLLGHLPAVVRLRDDRGVGCRYAGRALAERAADALLRGSAPCLRLHPRERDAHLQLRAGGGIRNRRGAPGGIRAGEWSAVVQGGECGEGRSSAGGIRLRRTRGVKPGGTVPPTSGRVESSTAPRRQRLLVDARMLD